MKKVLVLGGTRFFGKHLVKYLLNLDYEVTIATRGQAKDDFGTSVKRIILDRYEELSIKKTLSQEYYDVVYDNLAYSSNDIEILLANIKCHKYIVTSSTAVYDPLRGEVRESDFDSYSIVYKRDVRDHKMYAYGKRLVESAIKTNFNDSEVIMVRFPFIIGKDDYTKRLFKYVDHFYNHKGMYINNLQKKMSFISSDEAGEFLAFLSTVKFAGPINAASNGRLSMYDIFEIINKLQNDGVCLDDKINSLFNEFEKAPYNDTDDYEINTDLAKELGFAFTNVNDWIQDLIYAYVNELKSVKE